MERSHSDIKPKPHPGKGDRHLFCVHYSACLDEAVEMNWVSFNCGQCAAYAPERMDSAAVEAELVGCRALLMAVFAPGAENRLSK